MTAPAIAADEDVPTVRAVPTPASLTTAERNAVTISRLRPQPAPRTAAIRLAGHVAAGAQVVCDDTSTASATGEGAARALSDRLDMVPGVSIIEATELSEQQAHMGGLGPISGGHKSSSSSLTHPRRSKQRRSESLRSLLNSVNLPQHERP